MRKRFLAIAAILLALTLMFSFFSVPVFADGEIIAVVDERILEAKQVLLEHGIREGALDSIVEDEMLSLAQAFVEGSATSVSSIVSFDELAFIEYFVNSTEEVLLDCGLTATEIAETEKEFQRMRKKSNGDLANELDRSPAEVELIKEALTEQPNHRRRKALAEEDLVTASASISTSTLWTNMIRYAGGTGHVVSQKMTFLFEWLRTPIMRLGNTIGIAWGEGLVPTSISGGCVYKPTILGAYGGSSRSASTSIITPQAAVAYTFPCLDGVAEYVIRSGSMYVTLYQTKKTGRTAQVIGSYGHHVLQLSGLGISLATGAPSISFKTGVNTSPQRVDAFTV